MTGFVSITVFMWRPPVGFPMPAAALSYPVSVDPDVVVATIGPVSGSPDEARAGGWHDDDSGCWRGNFDIDRRRMSQGDGR